MATDSQKLDEETKARMQHAYRLGQLAMAARLYLKTGDQRERKALADLVNREMPPPHYEPIK